jgi:probable HAF family extracellular repeat protein
VQRCHLSRPTGATLIALMAMTVSCRDGGDLTDPAPQSARAAATGPTVTSVVPDSAPRGVTLDVSVRGSGFDPGSAVRLEREGVPAAGITTNGTTYLTSRRLSANITIAADADVGAYDVAVTTSGGRKGVGIESFAVTYVIDELGVIGGTWSRAHAINDQGEVVGTSCTDECLATAFYWSQEGGQVDLGGLAGYSRSAAYAINTRGQVFGEVSCPVSDPGCAPDVPRRRVRWEKVGGAWTIAPIDGCSVVTPVGDANGKLPINERDECVAHTASGLVLQTLSGTGVANTEVIPSPFTGSFRPQAYALNNVSMVAGSAIKTVGTVSQGMPVVWYRDGRGGWTALVLPLAAGDLRGFVTDIGDPDGAGLVRATGVTEGGYSTADYVGHGVRWTLRSTGAGGWEIASTEVLPTGGDKGRLRGWGMATSVAGDVVGHVGAAVSEGKPVKWLAGGGVEELPALKGGATGRAVDINAQGWIVGAVWDNGSRCDRAAIWRQQ